jgi:hypothetical protein
MAYPAVADPGYQIEPIVAVGDTVGGLTFASSGKPEPPAINNREEIAFSLFVNNTAGKSQMGAFFLGADGKLLPIALPGQALAGGATSRPS